MLAADHAIGDEKRHSIRIALEADEQPVREECRRAHCAECECALVSALRMIEVDEARLTAHHLARGPDALIRRDGERAVRRQRRRDLRDREDERGRHRARWHAE